MCGIVGYLGPKKALPVVMEGLRRLEYRGYDSAGVAIVNKGRLDVAKSAGRISVLASKIDPHQPGHLGIAHTRWATHGAPNDLNAHPHMDANGRIALVHNGIIENYQSLKTLLKQRGVQLQSDTDTECLVQLIGLYYEGDLEQAVRDALHDVDGTYGIAVISADEPDLLIAARKGSPLIVGIGRDEFILASDAAAVLAHTSHVMYLADGEMACITRDGVRTTTLDAIPVTKDVEEVEWTLDQIELGGREHFMQKEIFEQPSALRDCLRGRIDEKTGSVHLGGLADVARELTRARRIILTGCGTAWHAGLVGEYLFEELARIPTETEYASEFRYRNPIIEQGTVVIAISQSGETADTYAALKEAKERGALALGVVNVVGSTIARETDAGVYLHVGPEIGVASTKAFTGQVAVLTMMATFLGRRRHLSQPHAEQILRELITVPEKIQSILDESDALCREVAEQYECKGNWLYLGRGYNYPVALEGALKLKEVSYIHAEGLPAAEVKHGPLALIEEGTPVVVIAPRGLQYEKILSNIHEVKSRGGRIIAVTTEGNKEMTELADAVIPIPHVTDCLQPLLTGLPLQLIAYHAAVLRGCNVDKPRNLAKSVTVE